jgi:biotin synthase-related radical SAM superfamily protein
MSERCIYDCKFCPVPKLSGGIKDPSEMLDLVENASSRGTLKAIALTSGVAESPEREVQRAAEIVAILRSRYDLPIGVSVYPAKGSSEVLASAGADEIKYNVETMDPYIFSQVCPGLSLQGVLNGLEEAVDIFGKNRVFSNLIIGLGESDRTVMEGVEALARRGVIPILRPISASPLRAGEITIDRPSPDRLLSLARMQKKTLMAYGLDCRIAQTMCLPCTGCDITPFRDI